MRRRISATGTLLTKVVILTTFLTVNTGIVIGMLVYPRQFGIGRIAALALVTSLTVYFVWIALSLRVVSIDGSNLYVAKWFQEIQIPLSEVANVSDSDGLSSIVFVRLRRRAEFGERFAFLPRLGFAKPLYLFSSFPIVSELRELARQAAHESKV
jgi:hypothetical protein